MGKGRRARLLGSKEGCLLMASAWEREALRGVLSKARPRHVHEAMKPCSDDEGCMRGQLMGFMRCLCRWAKREQASCAACVAGPNGNKLACRLVLGC